MTIISRHRREASQTPILKEFSETDSDDAACVDFPMEPLHGKRRVYSKPESFPLLKRYWAPIHLLALEIAVDIP